MGKSTTSNKLKKSLKKSEALILSEHRLNPNDFDNPQAIKEILADCILNSDFDTFEDVLLAYIRTQPKTQLAQKTQLGRQTIYDLLTEGRKFNPEWDTLKNLLAAIN